MGSFSTNFGPLTAFGPCLCAFPPRLTASDVVSNWAPNHRNPVFFVGLPTPRLSKTPVMLVPSWRKLGSRFGVGKATEAATGKRWVPGLGNFSQVPAPTFATTKRFLRLVPHHCRFVPESLKLGGICEVEGAVTCELGTAAEKRSQSCQQINLSAFKFTFFESAFLAIQDVVGDNKQFKGVLELNLVYPLEQRAHKPRSVRQGLFPMS